MGYRQESAIGVLLASAARTVDVFSAVVVPHDAKGIWIFVDVTAIGTLPSVAVRVEMKDPVTGEFKGITPDLTAFTTTGEFVYYIGQDGAANTGLKGVQQTGPLPRTFRVGFIHGNTESITYSAGFSLVG